MSENNENKKIDQSKNYVTYGAFLLMILLLIALNFSQNNNISNLENKVMSLEVKVMKLEKGE